jgi:DNA-binding transcriptional ArsR family regulator
MTNYTGMKKLFGALFDENRLKLIDVLSERCEGVSRIAKRAGISQPLASYHLKVLKNAGIVRVESRSKETLYCIDNRKVQNLLEVSRKVVSDDK